MADDYTPTTKEVRADYADRPGSRRTPIQRWAEFDRWLAAHDAEKRSEWEAERATEEPEWEYGACYQADNGRELLWFSMGNGSFAIREAAEKEVERYADSQIVLGRRRKAGPWVPVEQEGESDALA